MDVQRAATQRRTNPMIDTVKFKQRLFVQASAQEFADPDVWRSEHKQIDTTDRDGRPVQRRRWVLAHKPTGFRASGTDDVLGTFEVSLPRVLFGHNGRLLKSQAEINDALYMVYDLMDQIGERSDEPPEFKRVDLVWQFQGDPNLFITAHQHARHRRIRRDVVKYEKGSLTWIGSGRSVCMYDKCLEMLKVPGEIMRVEVRLRDNVLAKLFGQRAVRSLNFDTCYELYRNTLLGFCPSSVPKVSAISEFLALAEREGWKSDGVSAFEIYTQRLSKKQRRRIQKQMAQTRSSVFNFDWADLLPVRYPPAPVEVSDNLIKELAPCRKGAL